MGNPGRAVAGALGPGARRAHDGGGQARPLQPPQRRPPGARGRLRPSRTRRRRGGPGRRRGAARGEPLERLGRAAAGPARAVPASRRSAAAPETSGGDGSSGSCGCRSTRRSTGEAEGERPRREALRGSGSAAATIAELLSSGTEVLAVCADASRRAGLAGLARFTALDPRPLCERCAGIAAEGLRRPAVTDYMALEHAPSLARGFDHRRPRRSAPLGPSRAPRPSPGRRLGGGAGPSGLSSTRPGRRPRWPSHWRRWRSGSPGARP